MLEEFQKIVTLIIQIRSEVKSRKINLIPSELTYLLSILNSIEHKCTTLSKDYSINQVFTKTYLLTLSQYLCTLLSGIKTWKGNLTDHQEEDLIILNSKLESLNDFLDFAPRVPVDDLFSILSTDPRWEKILKVVSYHHSDKTERVKAKYRHFMAQIASSQAFVSKGYEEVPGLKRMLMIGLGSIFYTCFKSRALRKTHLLYAQPRLEIAIHVWNLLETTMIRKLIRLVIKGISCNQVIYLPRTVSHVLEDYEDIQSKVAFDYEPFENCVKVRILSLDRVLPLPQDKTKVVDKVIIHVHGGGFISMSSESHQVYTNVWAREVGVPVFSIDYRLAPQHPFPAGLDDVWQAFNWLIKQGCPQLGIKIGSYVLVGDSAGGNLVLALAYKILKSGLVPPSGLVLAYPALKLDKDSCSPSLLHALEDLLVPHTFLKLCLESYLNGIIDITNPLISPSFIEDEVLEQLPVTRIMVGTEDPLHDECFRFTERLLENGVNVELAIFSGASHGGLSYSFKGGIKECRDMVALAGKWFKEIFVLE